MSNRKIDIKFLAKENIRKKPLRSISLISIIAIFVLFLFCGTILSSSISGGVNNLSNRLGADIRSQQSENRAVTFSGTTGTIAVGQTLEKNGVSVTLKEIILSDDPGHFSPPPEGMVFLYPVFIIEKPVGGVSGKSGTPKAER